MFQGGKTRKPPTNIVELITNLIAKLEKYSAIKDNYRSILIINIDGQVIK